MDTGKLLHGAEKRKKKLRKRNNTSKKCTLRRRDEMERTKETTKRIMELFEEKTNDAKEENITFGSSEADETCFLGVRLGEAVDLKRRTRRAMGA